MTERRKQEMEDVIRMLAKVWAECPELRFGQLIANVLPLPYSSDPFYITDAGLLRGIYDFRERFLTSEAQ